MADQEEKAPEETGAAPTEVAEAEATLEGETPQEPGPPEASPSHSSLILSAVCTIIRPTLPGVPRVWRVNTLLDIQGATPDELVVALTTTAQRCIQRARQIEAALVAAGRVVPPSGVQVANIEKERLDRAMRKQDLGRFLRGKR